MVRSVGAEGTCVLGLHKKREKVPHPGLQHVRHTPSNYILYGVISVFLIPFFSAASLINLCIQEFVFDQLRFEWLGSDAAGFN